MSDERDESPRIAVPVWVLYVMLIASGVGGVTGAGSALFGAVGGGGGDYGIELRLRVDQIEREIDALEAHRRVDAGILTELRFNQRLICRALDAGCEE